MDLYLSYWFVSKFYIFLKSVFCEEVIEVKVYKVRVDDVEFEVNRSVSFISKISSKAKSCYILVPKRIAKELRLENNDAVAVIITKISSIRLAPKGGGEK